MKAWGYLLLLFTLVHATRGNCPLHWEHFDGYCYFFSDATWTQQEATATCEQRRGLLASVKSVGEKDFLRREVLRRGEDFWIGLEVVRNSEGRQAGWRWQDGTDLDPQYADWGPGEPNDISREDDCVHYFKNMDFRWNDERCRLQKRYICKRRDNVTDLCDVENGWNMFGPQCIKYFEMKRSWREARQQCQDENADLIKVDTPAKMTILKESVFCNDASSAIWIGLSDTASPGTFMWVDRTSVDQFNWEQGQPKFNALGDNCVESVSALDFRWRSEPCGLEKKFICEKPLGSCAEGWEQHGSYCYLTQSSLNYLRTWFEAATFCSNQGATLLKITSFDEQQFVIKKLGDLRQAGRVFTWLGVTDRPKNGPYRWVDGSPVVYESWDREQPKSVPGRPNCGRISTNPANQGKWHTEYCFIRRSHLCRIPVGRKPQIYTPPPVEYSCEDGWQLFNDSCFLFDSDPRDADSAQRYCISQNAYLTHIESPDVQSFISVKKGWGGWMGLRYNGQSKEFRWVNGKVLQQNDFTNWDRGHPDTTGGKTCVVTAPRGQWRSRRCLIDRRFVCRKLAVHVTARTTRPTPTAPWSPECGQDWNYDPQEQLCYLIDATNRRTWRQARNRCRAFGADLASIHSSHEQSFITSLVQSHLALGAWNFWIGGTYRSRRYRWSDGTAFNYFNWEHGFPRRGGPCINMSPNIGGRWRNRPCRHRRPFICQKSALSKPTLPPPPTLIPTDCKAQAFLSGNHWIQDELFSASSHRTGYPPENSRLDSPGFPVDKKGCWHRNPSTPPDTMELIQVDFSQPIVVKGIITQGCREDASWVTKYKLEYQYDDKSAFMYYKDPPNRDKIFEANSDQVTHVQQNLTFPFQAIRVRLWPVEWRGELGLRWEILGCRTEKCSAQALITGYHVIPDNKLTASSSIANHGPEYSRINTMSIPGVSGGGWVPSSSDSASWIQASFGHDFRVTAVTTRGRSDAAEWVTSYKMLYSWDGTRFTTYQEPYGTDKTFRGNKKQNVSATNQLAAPVVTRFVRLQPVTWEVRIALRWEIQGCSPGCRPLDIINNPRHRLHNRRLKASSSVDANHGPGRSRINSRASGRLSGGWVAKYADQNQWIQADMERALFVRAVTTRGRDGAGEWVTAYRMSYGMSDRDLTLYREPDPVGVRIFEGNFDSQTPRIHYLSTQVTARVVRLLPYSWYRRIAVRWEILACTTWYASVELGCYADVADDRDLPNLIISNPPAGMHPRLCISHCFQEGYLYAGVQNGQDCYCGNQYGKHGGGRCNAKCTGDRSRVCGGFMANTVYSTGLGNTNSGCKPGWRMYDDRCYFINTDVKPWLDAQSHCRGELGDLATVNNEVTQAFVDSYISEVRKDVWIGLNSRNTPGEFFWSDGQPVLYTNWAPGEPNRYNDREDCVLIYQRSGAWNDAACERTRAFMCQAEPSENNRPVVTQAPPGCEAGWRGFRWNCYNIMGSQMKWSDALKECQAFGGSLLRIMDSHEQAFVTSQVLPRGSDYWTDLSDVNTPGTYTWSDGSQDVPYTHWDVGQPGSDRGKCVLIQSSGLWKDEDCPSTQRFICQKRREGFTTPPVPPSTTAPVGCAPGWVQQGNACYLGVFQATLASRQSWNYAEDHCVGLGGHLASFHKAEDAEMIWRTFVLGQSVSYWIGLNAQSSTEGYKWSDGSGVQYTRWQRGEPNPHGRCTEMNPASGRWRTQECTLQRNWICKLPLGVAPATLEPTSRLPTPEPDDGCNTGNNEWFSFMENCYYTSGSSDENQQVTWREAEAWCNDQGATLVSIHSQTEQNFVYGRVLGSAPIMVWTGLNELRSSGTYEWTDGSPLQYTYWGPGEPNDHGGQENCVAMGTETGLWGDEVCSAQTGFVCKRPKRGYVTPRTVPPPVQGNCPSGFHAFRNKCFQFNHYYNAQDRFRKNFTDALAHCNGQGPGVTLASISDAAEQNYLTSMFDVRRSEMWLGMRRYSQHGQFLWMDNTDVKYTNWGRGYPRDNAQEVCVSIIGYRGMTGRWRNIRCSIRRSWICQAQKKPGLPAPGPTSADPFCGEGWAASREGCYRMFTSVQTWQLAQSQCQSFGANLASIGNPYMQSWVWLQRWHAGSVQPIWIGLSDSQGRGSFSWVDGWPVTFVNWGRGQPVVNGTATCVHMSEDGKWLTGDCGWKLQFVCKKNRGPRPYPTSPVEGVCPDGDPDSPKDWVKFSGNCYLFRTDASASNARADTECARVGASLASVHSDAETSFLSVYLRTGLRGSSWIGLIKTVSGSFFWKDGSPVEYVKWAPGQPSDKDGSAGLNCVSINRDGLWSDSNCRSRRGFICKTPQVAAPNTTPSRRKDKAPPGGDGGGQPNNIPNHQNNKPGLKINNKSQSDHRSPIVLTEVLLVAAVCVLAVVVIGVTFYKVRKDRQNRYRRFLGDLLNAHQAQSDRT